MLTNEDKKRLVALEEQTQGGFSEFSSKDVSWLCAKLRESQSAVERVKSLERLDWHEGFGSESSEDGYWVRYDDILLAIEGNHEE